MSAEKLDVYEEIFCGELNVSNSDGPMKFVTKIYIKFTEKISQFLSFISIVICFFSLCAEVAANDEIIWLQPDFPPYFIVNGKYKSEGVHNKIVQHLRKRLPTHTHNLKIANYARILDSLKKQKQVAMAGMFITPERQKYVLYSDIPAYLVFPNVVITKRNTVKKFGQFLTNDGLLDFKPFVLSKKFKIGISLGRSYKGVFDEMILTYKNSGLFFERTGTDLFAGLLKMLSLNRLDAIIGYPIEAAFTARESGINSDDLEFLPASEMVPYIPAYVGVPKSAWGKAVMHKINNILNEEETIAEYSACYEYWINSSDSAVNRYRKHVKDYYSKFK